MTNRATQKAALRGVRAPGAVGGAEAGMPDGRLVQGAHSQSRTSVIDPTKYVFQNDICHWDTLNRLYYNYYVLC